MKTKIFSVIAGYIPAALVIIIFVLFSGLRQKEGTAITAAVNCNTGYSMSMGPLRQFMLDSLGSKKFEGGIYLKSEILNVINSMVGDSIYIVNGVIDCEYAKGTILAVASKGNSKVSLINWAGSGYCYPCPRPCCFKKFCVVNIDRSCATYVPYPNSIALNDKLETASGK